MARSGATGQDGQVGRIVEERGVYGTNLYSFSIFIIYFYSYLPTHLTQIEGNTNKFKRSERVTSRACSL